MKVIAEWSPRLNSRGPDPLTIVDATGAGRAGVTRPSAAAVYAYEVHQRRITGKHRIPTPVLAVAPLASKGLVTGVAAEEKLRHLAENDDLTGLRNRRSLMAHLSDRLAGGQPGPVAVLFLDLDQMKPVNDSLGHAAGDFYLWSVAERLRAIMAGAGMIARIGGDEFVVIPDQPLPIQNAESCARWLHSGLL